MTTILSLIRWTLILLLPASGGFALGRYGDQLLPWQPTKVEELESVGHTRASTRDTALQNLARVGEQVRLLQTRRAGYETASREAKVAYQILRDRGFSDESEECRQTVQRERSAKQQLEGLDQRLRELCEMESQLREICAQESGGHEGEEDQQGLREARAFILRTRTVISGPRTVIPDEQWSNGTDHYMNRVMPDGKE